MSNGGQCCALEICCDPLLSRAEKVAKLSKHMGVSVEECDCFLSWMEHEDLVFAPKSFSAVVQDIVAIAKKHKG